jgi:hypothetical protein
MTDIVKPFKILGTKDELGGNLGVFVEVSNTVFTSATSTTTTTASLYISIPRGEDIDMCVLSELTKMGFL